MPLKQIFLEKTIWQNVYSIVCRERQCHSPCKPTSSGDRNASIPGSRRPQLSALSFLQIHLLAPEVKVSSPTTLLTCISKEEEEDWGQKSQLQMVLYTLCSAGFDSVQPHGL